MAFNVHNVKELQRLATQLQKAVEDLAQGKIAKTK